MKRAIADLFWRMLRPSLADAWELGYSEGTRVERNGNYERWSDRPMHNPYRQPKGMR